MASKTTTRHTGRAAILDEMRARGLVHKSATGEESVTPGLEALFSEEKVTGYIGFDPTADSLHAGNLVPIMLLVHLQRHGHRPIGIVGGGTGLIGDPGGRSAERPVLSREEAEANLQGIRSQLEKFLDFKAGSNAAMLINNADWLDGMNLLDFLRDVGKHFTINYMQAKESVRLRMEQEEGISFTEFSYPLLQAFDFLTLYDRYGCKLQMGGSDQWGNLTTGVELLRRVRGVQAHVLAAPLFLTATGEKFGKSVGGGSVWLDPNKTSPFRFYQYWFNTDDRDVGKFLRLFTLIKLDEINELERAAASKPEERTAQRRLASEVTRMVHGETSLAGAVRASEVLFGGDVAGLSAEEVSEIMEDAPHLSVSRQRFEGEGVRLQDLIGGTGLSPSSGDARRSIQGGGIYLNNRRVNDVRFRVTLEHSIEGKVIILRRGAREYRLVRIED